MLQQCLRRAAGIAATTSRPRLGLAPSPSLLRPGSAASARHFHVTPAKRHESGEIPGEVPLVSRGGNPYS